MSGEPARTIAVAVAIMMRGDGCVLLCQRPPGKSYPLQWEFPGGKLEAGETAAQALRRELMEELAVDTAVGRLLHEQVSHYPDGGTFAVRYYLVESWDGEIRNEGFADMQWVGLAELPSYDILAGNREFCVRLAAEGLPAEV